MSAQATLNAIKGAAPILGVELLPQAVAGSKEVDAALARLPANTDAIFLPRDSSVGVHLQTFIAYADAHRLPLCVPGYHQVPEGALLSYGFYQHNIGRQAARLADQILRGTPAGDLPVEMAENLLAINADTAERIGLDIPAEILRQADKVFRTTTRP
jgi:putative ABC transport system substrate-binding protein